MNIWEVPWTIESYHELSYVIYNRFPTIWEGYIDANLDFIFRLEKFTSAYVYTLGGGAITWKSARKTILLSPQQGQNLALELAGNEADWLMNF